MARHEMAKLAKQLADQCEGENTDTVVGALLIMLAGTIRQSFPLDFAKQLHAVQAYSNTIVDMLADAEKRGED